MEWTQPPELEAAVAAAAEDPKQTTVEDFLEDEQPIPVIRLTPEPREDE